MSKERTFNEKRFIENLIVLRKKAGLTQKALAEKMSLPKGHTYISGVESGRIVPSLDSMIDLANALDVSLDVLCGNNPQLSYRDIARSLMLLYFLDDVKIDCSQKVPASSERGTYSKHIVTIQIEHGDLRRFMYQFDRHLNDRISPQEFMDWLDKKLEDLDASFPWEARNHESWDIFVEKMMREYKGKHLNTTETELIRKFFGGRDNAKLQTQDNQSRENPL